MPAPGALAKPSAIFANYLLPFLRLSPERSAKGTPQWNQEHPTRRSPSDAVPHGAERSKTPSSSLTTVTVPWGARSSTCRIRGPGSCPVVSRSNGFGLCPLPDRPDASGQSHQHMLVPG
jgi:hypothetical protein